MEIIEEPLKIGMINLCGSLGVRMNLEALFKYFNVDTTFVGIKFNNLTKGNQFHSKAKKSKTSFYNCITVYVNFHGRIIKPKVFCSGSVHIPGCKDVEEGPLILHLLVDKLLTDINEETFNKKIGDRDQFDPVIRIEDTMYTVQYKLNVPTINRTKIAEIVRQKYNVFAIYRPQRYPGVRVYYYSNDPTGPPKRKKVTIIIQNSGIVSVKGANTVGKYMEAYNFINKVIVENTHDVTS